MAPPHLGPGGPSLPRGPGSPLGPTGPGTPSLPGRPSLPLKAPQKLGKSSYHEFQGSGHDMLKGEGTDRKYKVTY